MTHLGFIGLGTMGALMAANVLKNGYPLTVFNRTTARCDPLVKAGAAHADFPADIARACEAVVIMVSDTKAVEEVLFGAHGISDCPNATLKTVIDMSTISPSASVSFSSRLKDMGVEMLDAPVSGGQKGAEEGTLSIMVGGNQDTFDRCRPIFQAMGKTISYIGGSGHGLAAKMINQVAGSISILAMVESMRVLAHSGVDPESTLAAISRGAARSGMMERYPAKILAGDFDPGFKISLMSKDLRLANEYVESLGLKLPVQQKVAQIFSDAEEAGFGDLGVQGIYKYFESTASAQKTKE